MAIESEIVNGTTIIIQEQIDPSWLIASGIALITLVGIILASRQTKKSNELLERELKIRLRPFFTLTKTQSSLQNHANGNRLRLYYTIMNTGPVPARKIVLRTFGSNNTEINDIVKDVDKKNPYTEIGTIPQGQTKDRFVDILANKEDKTIHTNWIIWLEYQYLDVKEKCVIVFPDITAGQQPVLHNWFLNEDVVEAEKRRDDERDGKISAKV